VTTESVGRSVVAARSLGRCELCGAQGDGVHHRLKRSAGGTWSPANLLRLCGSGTTGCHGRIEGNPADAVSLGLWLLRGEDPEATPVLCRPVLFGVDWWRLDDDGTVRWHDRAAPAFLEQLGALTGRRLDA